MKKCHEPYKISETFINVCQECITDKQCSVLQLILKRKKKSLLTLAFQVSSLFILWLTPIKNYSKQKFLASTAITQFNSHFWNLVMLPIGNATCSLILFLWKDNNKIDDHHKWCSLRMYNHKHSIFSKRQHINYCNFYI